MGCWNGTCAISNLPVFAGDPVYVFILMEPKTYGDLDLEPNRCYSTCWWAPLPIHFEGEYNDYGAVENCHGKLIKLLIDTIRPNLVEYKQGKNEYHDIAVTRKKFGLPLLFEADHEGRFKINDTYGIPRRAAHVIMHKSVVDGILTKLKIESYDQEPISYTEFMDSALDWLESVISALKKSKMDKELVLMMELMGSDNDNLFTRWMRSDKDSCPLGSITLTFTALFMNNEKALLNQYIRHLTFWMFIHHFMELKRTCWVPPSGAGSQSNETRAHEILVNLTQDKIKEQKKRFEDE